MNELLIYILGFITGIGLYYLFSQIRTARGSIKITYEPELGYSLGGLILSDYTMEDLAKSSKIILKPEVYIQNFN